MKRKPIVITVLVVVGILGLLIWGRTRTVGSAQTETTRELALSCTTDTLTRFHIHPHLTIAIDGVKQEIPADIGITPACMHPIHTHDTSGTIHVESPVRRDFTLSDFFAVWGQPFDQNHILDRSVDATHTITETVNGTPVKTFENTVLHDGDQIIITYGTKQSS